MIRLILLIGIIYLGFKIHRAWRAFQADSRRAMAGSDAKQVDDVMVKDPYCQVYFPQRSGVRATVENETLFFCSTACRDNYLNEKRKT